MAAGGSAGRWPLPVGRWLGNVVAAGRCPVATGWDRWPVAGGGAGWCGGRCSLAAAPALIPGGRRWAGDRQWPAVAGGRGGWQLGSYCRAVVVRLLKLYPAPSRIEIPSAR